MHAIIHKTENALEQIIPSWEKLSAEFSNITIFQSIDWLKSWWEYKKNGNAIRPYIVEIREENKTVGIIPLYLSYKDFANFHFRVLKPMGSEQSDYLIPILSKEFLVEEQLNKAFEEILFDKANWDYMEWRDMPEGSSFDLILKGKLLKGFSKIERMRTESCPYLIINNSFEEEFNQNVNNDFLKQVLSKERKLKNKGELSHALVVNEQEIEPVMNTFFEFHINKWGSTDTPSKFNLLKEKEFAINAARNLLKSNTLYLSYLTFNNEIVAIMFGMTDGKKVYYYIPTFDTKYKKYSVGNILIYYIIKYAYRDGFTGIDFLRGDEQYKYAWGSINNYNVTYTFYSRTFRSLLFKRIHQTYYSLEFNQKPTIRKVLPKTIIRGCIYMLAIAGKFKIHEDDK